MHCNGKCQMMKKIKQEEKKNDQLPNRSSQSKNEIPLSSKSYFPQITFSPTRDNDIFYSVLHIRKEIKMPRSVFHPPTA